MLRKVGEDFWADKFLKIQEAIQSGRKSEFASMNEVMSWYGGMGSFNDLIISKHNNHKVDSLNEEELNKELSRLRNEIYKYARDSIANS